MSDEIERLRARWNEIKRLRDALYEICSLTTRDEARSEYWSGVEDGYRRAESIARAAMADRIKNENNPWDK